MKKLFSTFFAFAMIVSLTALASCSKKEGEGKNIPTSAEVAKILDKGDLTNDDYSVLLDYVDGAFDEMLPLMDEAKDAANSGNYDKMEELQKKAQEIFKKYDKIMEVAPIIENASDEQLGEKGLKLKERIENAGLF